MHQETHPVIRCVSILEHQSSNIHSQPNDIDRCEHDFQEHLNTFQCNVKEEPTCDNKVEAISTHFIPPPRQNNNTIDDLFTIKSRQEFHEELHAKLESILSPPPCTEATKSLIPHAPRRRTCLMKPVDRNLPVVEHQDDYSCEESKSNIPHLEKHSELKNIMSKTNCNKHLAKQLMSLMVNFDMKKYSGLTLPRIPCKSRNRSFDDQSKLSNVLTPVNSRNDKIIHAEVRENPKDETSKCDEIGNCYKFPLQRKVSKENLKPCTSIISNIFKSSNVVNSNRRESIGRGIQNISDKENLELKTSIIESFRYLNSNSSNLIQKENQNQNYLDGSSCNICSGVPPAPAASLEQINKNDLIDSIASSDENEKSKHQNLNQDSDAFDMMQNSDAMIFNNVKPKTFESIFERKDLVMQRCQDRLSENDIFNGHGGLNQNIEIKSTSNPKIKPTERFLKNKNLKSDLSDVKFLKHRNFNTSAKDRSLLNHDIYKTQEHEQQMNIGDSNLNSKVHQRSSKGIPHKAKSIGLPGKASSISLISSTVASATTSEISTKPHSEANPQARLSRQSIESIQSALSLSTSASSYPQSSSSSSPTSAQEIEEATSKIHVQTLTIPPRRGRERIIGIETEPERYRNVLTVPIEFESKRTLTNGKITTTTKQTAKTQEDKAKKSKYINQTYFLTIPIRVRSKVGKHKHSVLADKQLENRITFPSKPNITIPRRVKSESQLIRNKIQVDIKSEDTSLKHNVINHPKLENKDLVSIPTGKREKQIEDLLNYTNDLDLKPMEIDDKAKCKSIDYKRYSRILTIPSKHKKRTFTIKLPSADNNQSKSSRYESEKRNCLEALGILQKPEVMILQESDTLTIPVKPIPLPRHHQVEDGECVLTYIPKIRSKTITRRKIKGSFDRPKVELTSVLARDSNDHGDMDRSTEYKESSTDKSGFETPAFNINQSSRIPRYRSSIKMGGKDQKNDSRPAAYISLPPYARPNTVNSSFHKVPYLLDESNPVDMPSEIDLSMTDFNENLSKEKDCFSEMSQTLKFDKSCFQCKSNLMKIFNKRVQSEITLIKHHNLNLNANSTDTTANDNFSVETCQGEEHNFTNRNISSLPIKSCLKVRSDDYKTGKVSGKRGRFKGQARRKSYGRLFCMKNSISRRRRGTISSDKFFKSRYVLDNRNVTKVENNGIYRKISNTDAHINSDRMSFKHRDNSGWFNPYIACKDNNVLTAFTNKEESSALKFLKNLFGFKLNKNLNAKSRGSPKRTKKRSPAKKKKRYNISKTRELSPTSLKSSTIKKPSNIQISSSKRRHKPDIANKETPAMFFKQIESKKLGKDVSALSLVPSTISEGSRVKGSPSSSQYFSPKLKHQLEPVSLKDIPPKCRNQESCSVISTTSSESSISEAKMPDRIRTPTQRAKTPTKPPILKRDRIHKFPHRTQALGLSRSGSSASYASSSDSKTNYHPDMKKISISISSSNIVPPPTAVKDALTLPEKLKPPTTSGKLSMQLPHRTQSIGLPESDSSTSVSSFYTLDSFKSDASSPKPRETAQTARETISKPEFTKMYPFRSQQIGLSRSGSEESVSIALPTKQKIFKTPVTPPSPTEINSTKKETQSPKTKSLKDNKEQNPRPVEALPQVDYFTIKSAKLVASVPKTADVVKRSPNKTYVSTLKVDLKRGDQQKAKPLKKVESSPGKFQMQPSNDKKSQDVPMFDKNRLVKLARKDKSANRKRKLNKGTENVHGHTQSKSKNDYKKAMEENIPKIVIPDGKTQVVTTLTRPRVIIKLTSDKGKFEKDDKQIIEEHHKKYHTKTDNGMMAEEKSVKIHPKVIKEKEGVEYIPKVKPIHMYKIPTPKHFDRYDNLDERRILSRQQKSMQNVSKSPDRGKENKQNGEKSNENKKSFEQSDLKAAETDKLLNASEKLNKNCDKNIAKPLSRKYAKTVAEESENIKDGIDKRPLEMKKSSLHKDFVEEGKNNLIGEIEKSHKTKIENKQIDPKTKIKKTKTNQFTKDDDYDKIEAPKHNKGDMTDEDDEQIEIPHSKRPRSRIRPASITAFPVRKETTSKKFYDRMPKMMPREDDLRQNKGDKVDKKALKLQGHDGQADKVTFEEHGEPSDVPNIAKLNAKEMQTTDPKKRKVSLGPAHDIKVPTSEGFAKPFPTSLQATELTGFNIGELTKIDKGRRDKEMKKNRHKRSISAKRFREIEILKKNLQNLQNEVSLVKTNGSELTIEELIRKLCQNLVQKSQESSSDAEDVTLTSIDQFDQNSSDADDRFVQDCSNSSTNCNAMKLRNANRNVRNITSYIPQRKEVNMISLVQRSDDHNSLADKSNLKGNQIDERRNMKQKMKPICNAFDSNSGYVYEMLKSLNNQRDKNEAFKIFRRLKCFKPKTEEYDDIEDFFEENEKRQNTATKTASTKLGSKLFGMSSQLCKDCALELAAEKRHVIIGNACHHNSNQAQDLDHLISSFDQ